MDVLDFPEPIFSLPDVSGLWPAQCTSFLSAYLGTMHIVAYFCVEDLIFPLNPVVSNQINIIGITEAIKKAALLRQVGS